jgi:membrane protein implicated in regulation of membrane protease activity
VTVLWWHWLVVGLALVALELATAGGFYVIFFGVAALLIAGLQFIGIGGPLWFQILLFSIFAVGSLLLFRGRLMQSIDAGTGQTDIDSLVGEVGAPLEDIAPGAIGRFELRGTTWTARNAGTATIVRGRRSIVLGRDRFTLFVTAEEAA